MHGLLSARMRVGRDALHPHAPVMRRNVAPLSASQLSVLRLQDLGYKVGTDIGSTAEALAEARSSAQRQRVLKCLT